MMAIPVIDLFAGPGGLGEGFSECVGQFEVKLSVEVDPVACATLRLRKFFHLSRGVAARESYYSYVRGEISEADLIGRHREIWKIAKDRVLNVELGEAKSRILVHRRINSAIGGRGFVLIGGPPCQAYSIIGRSRRLGLGTGGTDTNTSRSRRKLESEFYSDPKHRLYREYLEIIALHRPIAFVMENVKGLGSAKKSADDSHGGMFARISADLKNPLDVLRGSISPELEAELGPFRPARYRLVALSGNSTRFLGEPMVASDFVVRSELHGIPQARHRIIIVGLRDDLDCMVGSLDIQPAAKLSDVLSDLPPLRSGVSRGKDDWLEAIESQLWRIPHAVATELCIPALMRRIRSAKPKLTEGGRWIPCPFTSRNASSLALKWICDNRLGGILQHEARSHMASDLVRYLYCSAFASRYGRSPSLEEWPGSLRPDHVNIKNHHGKLYPTGFSDRFKVQCFDRPSSTVTSHIAKDGHYYIHFDPTQCRSLTVRETARLQTFPDNYFFCGNRTQQYQQVGNAVPPLLARQIGKLIAEALTAQQENLEVSARA